MLRLNKVSILFLLFLLVGASCKKTNKLITLSDFLSRDDSDPKIPREYKTWILEEGSIAQVGIPTIVYKRGQPIQSNFDPSKISYVFSANNTYQGTDEKGKPEQARWNIDDAGKKLTLFSGNSIYDSFDIIQITRQNFDVKNKEMIEGNEVIVTLKFLQKK
jgi:hypothetical protein